MLSDDDIELHPVARIYYTHYQTRTYKRASVTDGPGEPLCFLSLAKEVVRRKVASACAERDARIAELEQQLEEARGGSSVFAFRYSSCTHEEGMRVVSLHSTQEAAREAMEQHKAEQKAEWDSSVLEVLGFPWSDEHGSGSERWDVIEMQVNAAIKEQT